MNISIEEISNAFKDEFKDADVLFTDHVYEKIENSDNLKLVIFINKLFEKNISVLYTKFIFVVDSEKKYLVNNSFSYLYDINCVYNQENFEDIEDFKNRIRKIYDDKKFGDNLKILSKFIESPSFLINEWLEDNDVTNISIVNVEYNPKIHIIPCKSLFFSFNLNINNTENVELIIKKENDNVFVLDFKIYDKTISVEKQNLSTLVETIGDTLKNNI